MQVWEFDRYEWSKLQSMGDSTDVPRAIMDMLRSQGEQEAKECYWRIDNNVIVQGTLYESALPTIVCLMTLLHHFENPGRRYALELIHDVAWGEIDTEEGYMGLKPLCINEIIKGCQIFFDELVNGDVWGKIFSVDIIRCICVESDDIELKNRAVWYLEKLKFTDDKDDIYRKKAIEVITMALPPESRPTG